MCFRIRDEVVIASFWMAGEDQGDAFVDRVFLIGSEIIMCGFCTLDLLKYCPSLLQYHKESSDFPVLMDHYVNRSGKTYTGTTFVIVQDWPQAL